MIHPVSNNYHYRTGFKTGWLAYSRGSNCFQTCQDIWHAILQILPTYGNHKTIIFMIDLKQMEALLWQMEKEKHAIIQI